MKKGAAVTLIRKMCEEKTKRKQREKFEKWKFLYIASKQGVQVLTQMRTLHMQYLTSPEQSMIHS